MRCLPPCSCAPADFDPHTAKRYTFQQRSEPRWAVLAGGECNVELKVTNLTKGRVFLTAATYSAPLWKGQGRSRRNFSVATNSLYALLHG